MSDKNSSLEQRVMQGGTAPAQPPVAPEFPFLPLPLHYNVSQAPMNDGTVGVTIVLTTPAGSIRCVVPPDGAIEFGANLDRIGRMSKTGLIVP